MSNKADANAKANALLWILMQIHSDKVNPIIIKGVHTVADSNLSIEKVCMDCTNGDTIEFNVNDEDRSVCVAFIPKKTETNTDKIVKGVLFYSINKWPDEFESSQLSAYMTKLMYIIRDVYAMYKNCTLVTKCTWGTHSNESAADPRSRSV